MEQEQEQKRRLGRPPRVQPDSPSPASFGELGEEMQPSTTSTPAATPETPASGKDSSPISQPSAQETPAMQELKAKMEAQAEAEPERGPHPYKWSIAATAMIPFGFRDPATGDPSKERIEAHVAECWRAETIPSIAGVLVTLPKQD